jgi:DNA adenine methylase
MRPKRQGVKYIIPLSNAPCASVSRRQVDARAVDHRALPAAPGLHGGLTAAAASVLMRKPRAKLVEVYNDLDGEIVSLFRVLRDPETAGALARLLEATPFARDEFALSYEPCQDALEQARRTVVRSFMGFGSDSASGTKTGFRANGNRQSAHPAKDWSNYPAAVAAFCERLQGVVIENRPALEVLLQHDGPEALHYCDPPYLPETRKESMIRTGKATGTK